MDFLPFGASRLPVDPALLRGEIVRFAPTITERPAAAELVIGRALETATSGRLRDLARGAGSAVILVPGIDRIAAVSTFVPPLLAELQEAGIPSAHTKVFLATGTHEHKGLEDLRALLGSAVAAEVECVIHDPRASQGLVDVGMTTRGTPVEFARSVMECEVKILTGRVVPHYFAGFGGGRKALLPGAAGLRTILANHRLTLAPESGVAAGVGPCALEGNPVHLDMVEAVRFARPTFCVNMLLDTKHQVVAAHAGDPEASHAAACEEALIRHQLRATEQFDGVITSAGGTPYDCNFVQALKALFDVQEIVRTGGTILCVAECPLGIGPAFLDWAALEDDSEVDRLVRERYNLAGHNTIMLRSLLRRATIGFVSRLDPDLVRRLGLHPFDSLDAGLRWLSDRLSPASRVACVPYANVTHVAYRPEQIA